MSTVDWDDVPNEGKSSDNLDAFIEGALRRPDLSAAKIGDKLNMKAGSYKPAGVVRRTAAVMLTMGEFRISGKIYALTPVQPRPELVKKPA